MFAGRLWVILPGSHEKRRVSVNAFIKDLVGAASSRELILSRLKASLIGRLRETGDLCDLRYLLIKRINPYCGA